MRRVFSCYCFSVFYCDDNFLIFEAGIAYDGCSCETYQNSLDALVGPIYAEKLPLPDGCLLMFTQDGKGFCYKASGEDEADALIEEVSSVLSLHSE